MPQEITNWLDGQKKISLLPPNKGLLVETFIRKINFLKEII